jgi:signal transduction histidine kinase
MIAIAASVVLVFRDLTQRRQVERMKAEFVSIVSHELRTPLTSIRGSLGLLGGGLFGGNTEKGKRMLEIAIANTDRLIRLLNDVLDIEKLESGKISLQLVSCDAGKLMQQSAEEMGVMAQKQGVALRVSPIAARIVADPDRLLQCLTNLLSNAIKFSDSGSEVALMARTVIPDLRFEVRDRGRGIPKEKLHSIFEPFQQVDSSDSRRRGGTGLGLSICREIVRQHGGTLAVESELGKGSTFYFTIPLDERQQLENSASGDERINAYSVDTD